MMSWIRKSMAESLVRITSPKPVPKWNIPVPVICLEPSPVVLKVAVPVVADVIGSTEIAFLNA